MTALYDFNHKLNILKHLIDTEYDYKDEEFNPRTYRPATLRHRVIFSVISEASLPGMIEKLTTQH